MTPKEKGWPKCGTKTKDMGQASWPSHSNFNVFRFYDVSFPRKKSKELNFRLLGNLPSQGKILSGTAEMEARGGISHKSEREKYELFMDNQSEDFLPLFSKGIFYFPEDFILSA